MNKTRKPKDKCDIVLAKSNLDFKIEFTKSKKDEKIKKPSLARHLFKSA